MENEDVVNLPNWLPLRFRRPGGAWIGPDTTPVLEHNVTLHLSSGLMERLTRYGLGAGAALLVRQLRFVHMADPHLAGLRTEFTAEGFSGPLVVEAALDGGVTNAGVPRYAADLDGRHLTHVVTGTSQQDAVWLRCRTRTSDVRIAYAARLTSPASVTVTHDRPLRGADDPAGTDGGEDPDGRQGRRPAHLRDAAISDPMHAAVDRVHRAALSTSCWRPI